MQRILPVLALAAFAGGVAAQEAGPQALAGAWTATSAERDGAAASDLVGHVLTFDASGFTIVAPDGATIYAGTFNIDPAASPAAIDFHNVSGLAAGTEWEGIYRLEGDALTIVDDAPDPSRGRPEEFAAPAESGFVLVEFRRGAGG